MRPISRFLIIVILLLGSYEFFSVVMSTDAIHKKHLINAYRIVVELGRINKERLQIALALGNRHYNPSPRPELMQGSAVRNLSFEQSGAIRAELDERTGVDGGVLYYLPLMKNGEISEWTCVTHDYPDIGSFLPQCEYIAKPKD
jgi:hypothetical protein